MTYFCGVTQCHSNDEADVCYSGYRTNKASNMYKGASTSSPLVIALPNAQALGRQSNNRLTCTVPPTWTARPSYNGFIWCYKAGSGAGFGSQGWVPAADIATDSSIVACGPAGQDTACANASGCAGQSPCDGSGNEVAGSGSGARTVASTDAYMRLSCHGTAIWYLVSGDTVNVFCVRRHASFPEWYGCCEVVTGKWCPAGTRGWAPMASLV